MPVVKGKADFPVAHSDLAVGQMPRSIMLFRSSERSTQSRARHRQAQSFAQEFVSPPQNGSGRWRHYQFHREFRIFPRLRDKHAMQQEGSWHYQQSTKLETSAPELRPDCRRQKQFELADHGRARDGSDRVPEPRNRAAGLPIFSPDQIRQSADNIPPNSDKVAWIS